MQILTFNIEINAGPERTWDSLFDKENYKKWTSVFQSGSYYEGLLEQNAEIMLLTPEGHGMFSIVSVYEPYLNLTFMHQGEIMNGQKGEIIYNNAYEKYLLEDLGKSTRLTVKINCEEEYVNHMKHTFPSALQRIKEIAEDGR